MAEYAGGSVVDGQTCLWTSGWMWVGTEGRLVGGALLLPAFGAPGIARWPHRSPVHEQPARLQPTKVVPEPHGKLESLEAAAEASGKPSQRRPLGHPQCGVPGGFFTTAQKGSASGSTGAGLWPLTLLALGDIKWSPWPWARARHWLWHCLPGVCVSH